jgi:gliding motility-associated-like protein
MVSRSTSLLLGLAIITGWTLSGCGKEKDEPNGGTLDRPLFLHVDSACVQLPNVFTPNGDGINDILVALGDHVTDLHMVVKTFEGEVIWQGAGGWPGWDGRKDGVLLPNRAYRVSISATSLASQPLSGTTSVFLAGDPEHTCFSTDQEPITGDMFEPGQCAPIYHTNDRFCTKP